MQNQNFITLPLETGELYDFDDGNFHTKVFGFLGHKKLVLPEGYTHFGIVTEGIARVRYSNGYREVRKGEYFSVYGECDIVPDGAVGLVNSAYGYRGMQTLGGPVEETGRLKYIDGCTDSLLVPPVKKGDPCLNHLHFPRGIDQTAHTHPSVRTGIVLRGSGLCLAEDKTTGVREIALERPLVQDYAFVIPTDTLHKFRTDNDTMDVIAFHPDSDFGPEDEEHPMINRTLVGGISAKVMDDIRTK